MSKNIQASLFDTPPAHTRLRRAPRAAGELRGMVRHPAHETSIEAAEKIVPVKERVQTMILEALESLGPMNDGELELLPRFSGLASITVRARRVELYKMDPPKVVKSGIRRDHPLRPGSSMNVWALPEKS
jgi:hypothetical protein